MGSITHKDLDCIFIHIPKTGGNSILTALFGSTEVTQLQEHIEYHKNLFKSGYGHWTALELMKSNIPEYKKRFSFCTIRNPYYRFVSAYFHIITNVRTDLSNISFENFTQSFVSGKIRIPATRSLKLQSDFIYDNNKQPLIKYIMRLENIQNDFEILTKKLNINIDELPHVNKSIKRNKPYLDYYNEKTKSMITDWYKKDFELLNYPKELK